MHDEIVEVLMMCLKKLGCFAIKTSVVPRPPYDVMLNRVNYAYPPGPIYQPNYIFSFMLETDCVYAYKAGCEYDNNRRVYFSDPNFLDDFTKVVKYYAG